MKDGQDDIVEKMWRFFSSMKLGLVLLGLLALAAGLGTAFPQASLDPEKARAVGQLWQKLGFTELYGTIWFRLLLGLLCLNLIVCSIQRFQGIYNRTFALKPPVNSSVVPNNVRTTIPGERDVLKVSVHEALKQRRFKVNLAEHNQGFSFTAVKRRWGNWGSLISHISFVVLVIGAFIGTTMGFKGFLMAGEGTTTPIKSIHVSKGTVNQDFQVHIHSAEDRFLPNGERDNWYTDIAIIENDQEVVRKTISVNHPLSYKGVMFYQSSFSNGANLTIDLNGQKIPVVLQDHGGNYYKAPNTDLYLLAEAIRNDPQKPMMLYRVYKGTDEDPIQRGQVTAGETIDVQGEYTLTFEGNAGFTGLQIKKDPGITFIWIGCGLLMLGLFLSFYWRPVAVLGIYESGRLTMGAMTGKSVDAIKQEFDQLIHDIRAK